ncbi:unnamed protein product [Microthlaspi erraticum]|uniref:Integrase catalytic domain-containing protein n=1 Tax=Microthlaspi erraticum TaxID=1685480 RepID=A0A6D2HJT8_9BRAS|nr:unnamed protein product [Microthlaspi erraticum]
MIGDCINVAAKCVPCQRYAPAINAPTQALQAAIPAYPFMRWGMDIVGPMPRSRQCAYLLVYIICRHGLPYEIVTDNGGQFVAATFREFCASWNIKITYSTPRYPQANGQAESTNKTIVDGLKKRLEGYQGAWADELDGVLWSHRTTPRTASGETPFSLSHGCEALAPAELHVASLRRSLMPLNPALNDDSLLHSLDHAEELRDRALLRMQNYQQQATRYYDRKVRNRRFELYDLVSRRSTTLPNPSTQANSGSIGKGRFASPRSSNPGSTSWTIVTETHCLVHGTP